MIIIAVLAMRLPTSLFWGFRSGVFVLILTLARLAVGGALAVGGYGLFQRTAWADRVVWTAAIAQIVVAIIGLGYSLAFSSHWWVPRTRGWRLSVGLR